MSPIGLAAWLVVVNGSLFGTLVFLLDSAIKRKDPDAFKWNSIAIGTIIAVYLLAQMFGEGVTP